MSILTPANFSGAECNIPNADDSYTGVAQTVQSLIDEYEPELLTIILGATLYSDLLAGLAVMPTPDAKWTALRDKVIPMDRRYCYYNYLDNNIVQQTGIGTQATTTEAGNRASAWGTMVKQWNKMVKGNHELNKFLTNNPDYPDYVSREAYIPFYVNGWFDYDYYLGCYGQIVPEVYRFKNSLGL